MQALTEQAQKNKADPRLMSGTHLAADFHTSGNLPLSPGDRERVIAMDASDLVYHRVVAKKGSGGNYDEGVILAVRDVPSVLIYREDGTRFWWRLDLCEVGKPIPNKDKQVTELINSH